jgi:glycosyltransferase involved in cell wall biosynthesis
MDPEKGGVCQAIRTMITGLEESGIHNEVVSLDEPDAGFLKNDKFPVHALGKGKGPWRYNALLIPWLTDNFKRFDAVIVHGIWLYQSYAVNKAMRIFKKNQWINPDRNTLVPELFVMPHGMLDPYFQLATGRKIKALRNQLYYKFIEGAVINGADSMLFTCEEERMLARKPFRPYNPKKEMVVGLGVEEPVPDTSITERAFADTCQAAGQEYILYLGRIHEKKGVDILIQAYAYVTEMHKRKHTVLPRLVIAGPGLESAFGKQMQQQVANNPFVRNAVFFPGMLTGNAKWGAFHGCEAFALCSHQENFGISVVEALACGKPVLVSNQVNIWKEIKNEDAGMVSTDNLSGTIDLLNRWIIFSREEKKQMGKNARICFEKNFSLQPAVSRLVYAIANKD